MMSLVDMPSVVRLAMESRFRWSCRMRTRTVVRVVEVEPGADVPAGVVQEIRAGLPAAA